MTQQLKQVANSPGKRLCQPLGQHSLLQFRLVLLLFEIVDNPSSRIRVAGIEKKTALPLGQSLGTNVSRLRIITFFVVIFPFYTACLTLIELELAVDYK
ncbi:hypothetical protein OUZ56_031308 [Daphnia magna]|uniref:Uncharacterized protein n=1 Tax=Daphnia magna TaxID=35525 RepID=A0ABQ9ZTV3_9CRUS|nr:hypothetical protein OUZ56_031308 [Daphnia magna]